MKASPLISTKQSNSPGKAVAKIPPSVKSVLRSTGQPLETVTRRFMEPHVGLHASGTVPVSRAEIGDPRDPSEQEAERVASKISEAKSSRPDSGRSFDFGRVRIHTGAEAAESARAVNARAYSVGNHVVFGEGQFDPARPIGQRLLAHELTHVAQTAGAGSIEHLPVLRQVDSDSEERRRRAVRASLDWLVVPPIVMDDNAPALIDWAQKEAIEFEAPETTDERRHYLAQGLLRVLKELKEFESRAKRDQDGALLYTNILTDSAVPWTGDRAQSLDAVEPFTPGNIAEWRTAARPPRPTRRKGGKKEAAAPAKPSHAAEPPPASMTATNISFSKQAGMTLKTEEGQRMIMRFVLGSTRQGYTADQLDWVAGHLGLEKRWAPPTGVDLATWQETFEAIPLGGKITLTITKNFTLEVDGLLSDVPSRRAFQLEGFRKGVVDAKAGLYLGIGTFAVGTLAFGGGALLGTSLSAGGALGGGSLLSGGGLLGGGVSQSASAVGSYLSLNAPALAADAFLYGGAVTSGVALGQHLSDVRSQGVHWHDIPRLGEDLLPLASGYAESTSFRLPRSGGGDGGEEPPGDGGGGGIPTGRQTIRSSPPPMPDNPTAIPKSSGTPTLRSSPPPIPDNPTAVATPSGTPTMRSSPPPSPSADGPSPSGPRPATDVDIIKANVASPSSVQPQDPDSHQADWAARGGLRTAPPAYHDSDGSVRVSTDHPLLRPATTAGIPSISGGGTRRGPHVFTLNTSGGPVPPVSAAPVVQPAPAVAPPAVDSLAQTGAGPPVVDPLAQTGAGPAAAPAVDPLAQTGAGPAAPPVVDPLAQTGAGPAARPAVDPLAQTGAGPAPPPVARPGVATGGSQPLPTGDEEGPQAISAQGVQTIRNLPPRVPVPGARFRRGAGNNVNYSVDHDAHELAWQRLGGRPGSPPAFIFSGQVYLDPSRWPPAQ